ncbi:MAG: hypothetical protein R2712_27320 [Vicinamibacterales bacterium]
MQRLVACARAHPRAVVGALLLSWAEPHRGFQVGQQWDTWYGGWRMPQHLSAFDLPREPFEVEAIVGNCVLFPAEALRAHGLIDARRFPRWWGDAELTSSFDWAGGLAPARRAACDGLVPAQHAAAPAADPANLEGHADPAPRSAAPAQPAGPVGGALGHGADAAAGTDCLRRLRRPPGAEDDPPGRDVAGVARSRAPMTVLVFHLGSLGDTIVTIPVLRAVRRHWPAARRDAA